MFCQQIPVASPAAWRDINSLITLKLLSNCCTALLDGCSFGVNKPNLIASLVLRLQVHHSKLDNELFNFKFGITFVSNSDFFQ